MKKLVLMGYCDNVCDCPTCHIGIDNPLSTDPTECGYCQKRMFDQGVYDTSKPTLPEDNYCSKCGHKL